MRDTLGEVASLIHRFSGGGGERAIDLRFLRGPFAGERVARNASTRLPAASVSKILVALAIYRHAYDHKLALDEQVRVGDFWFLHPEDGSVFSVFEGDTTFTLRELVGLMLITSDNLSASHLAEIVGRDRIAEVAADLGSSDTSFDHPFDPRNFAALRRGNLTTASDVSTWMIHLYDGTVPGASEILAALRHSILNFRLTARFDRFQAHKSGTVEGVANDAAVLRGTEHDISLVVLSSNQPDTLRFSVEAADLAAEVWGTLGESLK